MMDFPYLDFFISLSDKSHKRQYLENILGVELFRILDAWETVCRGLRCDGAAHRLRVSSWLPNPGILERPSSEHSQYRDRGIMADADTEPVKSSGEEEEGDAYELKGTKNVSEIMSLDTNDESLRKYKESLLGSAAHGDLGNVSDPRRLVVEEFRVLFGPEEGKEDVVHCLGTPEGMTPCTSVNSHHSCPDSLSPTRSWSPSTHTSFPSLGLNNTRNSSTTTPEGIEKLAAEGITMKEGSKFKFLITFRVQHEVCM
jgi:hypothetical protein